LGLVLFPAFSRRTDYVDLHIIRSASGLGNGPG
jgi:hypothetical protein